jgi:hypothetical protein
MRRNVGTARLWGAFGVTLFGIFMTPVFLYVIRLFAGPVREPAVVATGLSQTHGLAAPVPAAAADRGAGPERAGGRLSCRPHQFDWEAS